MPSITDMKDAFGRELKVGDWITYGYPVRGPRFGKIVGAFASITERGTERFHLRVVGHSAPKAWRNETRWRSYRTPVWNLKNVIKIERPEGLEGVSP
jgi:hypothetical protein